MVSLFLFINILALIKKKSIHKNYKVKRRYCIFTNWAIKSLQPIMKVSNGKPKLIREALKGNKVMYSDGIM
ncbi:hypothetical protein DKB98_05835 [Enterococcus faecalis]|nr:hypothetical protein DKC02_03850 [Enterococcus faecalis]PWI85462.1 hypothetical protein DKC03_12525 [Enterococcus faecalis]PWI87865.1 hypothetical protein DKB98_05835 [Enterococcus faecalis]